MPNNNLGCNLDTEWLNKVHVNLPAVNRRTASLTSHRAVKKNWQAAWLLRAISCIDLTTLGGDDTKSNVMRLCAKAAQPVSPDLLIALGFDEETAKGLSSNRITTAAVCVYPAKVSDAVDSLQKLGVAAKIQVASVATGFPSGQYPLKTRLEEIRFAVEEGATEIDIVIDRSLVLTHQWRALYDELKEMKKACGPKVHMKSILAVGELGSLTNVYKASLVAMMAGSDFIKTSTGKEAVNATLAVGLVMCRAIRDYHQRIGFKVGFKPAGGIRTAKDAINWLILIKEELGDDWLSPELFRFGASGLLTDIERQLYHHVTGRYACAQEFTMG
ncbi:deoxyribose-phosphate aldolase [Anabrus simplex]|uniref:deoxyribose-phosphate aldolase n=1 Tax=Anabrus simplex TaxID=316456 RepID=UPI0034DD373F